MKRLIGLTSTIIILFILLFAGNGRGAAYCVSQAGAGAKSGADVDNASDIATFNAGTAPYNDLDDDTVYLMDTITTAVVVPDGGSSAVHPVTIRGDYTGHACTITGNLTPILKVAKDYVVIDGFALTYSGTTTTALGFNINGVRTGVIARNFNIDMGGYAVPIAVDGNNTGTILENITATNWGSAKQSIYFYGAANTNITLINITANPNANSRSITLNTITGLTINGLSVTGGAYRALDITSCSGIINISGLTIAPSSGMGIQFTTTAFGAGSTIASTTISGADSTNGALYFSSCTGTFAGDVDITSNTSGMPTVHFLSSAMTNATLSGSATTGAGVGVKLNASSGIRINDFTVSSTGSPFWVMGASSDIQFNRCSGTVSGVGTSKWLIEDSAATISHTDCTITGGGGFYVQETANNISYLRCTATNSNNTGFWAIGESNTIAYTGCLAQNSKSDGFGTMGTDATHRVHDVTYAGCRATGNGAKTSTSDGDGFTAHYDDYNIFIYNSIADNNTASGYAMGGTTSGRIYNSIADNNAADWSVEGGGKLDQTRGGFLFANTDVNGITGTSWTMRNSIGYSNYPRELRIEATAKDIISLDYNLYYPEDASRLASLDGATTNINWATYHGTYESNSPTPADPLFVSSTDFHLLSGSPAINKGTPCAEGETSVDFVGIPVCTGGVYVGKGSAREIGAYEFIKSGKKFSPFTGFLFRR